MLHKDLTVDTLVASHNKNQIKNKDNLSVLKIPIGLCAASVLFNCEFCIDAFKLGYLGS